MMAEDKISKLEERKRKLEKQIKEEKEKELIKFSKWFFNRYDIENSNEAKKIINELEVSPDIRS